MKVDHLGTPSLSSPLHIGPVVMRNRVFLAPMSGVSDLPFRRLAWRYGAGLVVTEMIASRELVGASRESLTRLAGDGIQPHVVQLAGRQACWMARAARLAVDAGAAMIDINMGCPAKKVTGGYSGSALMRDPDHALSLIEATVNAVSVPVSLKIRLGWDENTINASDIARRAEDAGISMITVHGRTRNQFYTGHADWRAIARVRAVTRLPLVANGDVETAEDAAAILRASGADATMVGRAAQGQPWLPGLLAAAIPSAPCGDALAQLICEHYEAMLCHHGVETGVRHARKHLGWYIDRHAPDVSAALRQRIMTAREPGTVMTLLRNVFETAPGSRQERAA